MSLVVNEAWELVEDGLITEEDFRDFTFANPVGLWAANNPNFFKGTSLEREVAQTARLARVPPRIAPRNCRFDRLR